MCVLDLCLQAHSAQPMVLQGEDSHMSNPAAEVAAFKAKWASAEDGQTFEEEEEEEDVVAGLKAALLAAGQHGLLTSDVVPAATEEVGLMQSLVQRLLGPACLGHLKSAANTLRSSPRIVFCG